MNLDQSEQAGGPVGVARKGWVTPQVNELRAGAAENTPGDAISDTPLEAIGS
jgi:hypothetical protein